MTLEGRAVVTAQYTKGKPQNESDVFAFVVSAESGVWR
jgi:hypothetical protein